MSTAKALEFSEFVHKDDFRLSGEKVSDHTARVHNLLKKSGIKKTAVLEAAILHHSLDKSDEHLAYIKETLGAESAELIYSYKNLSNNIIKDIDPKDLNKKLILETYLSLANNLDLIAIRLADKADNVKSLKLLDKVQATKSAERARYIYAPLSKFTGFGYLTSILEDESFRYLEPENFEIISQYKRKYLKDSSNIMKKFVTEVEQLLKSEGIQTQISARKKHNYSIYKKLFKYKRGDESFTQILDRIHDIVACRIIVGSEEECYFVEDILNSLYEVVLDERDDYISRPKPSGYKSLHNIYQVTPNLLAEVQIKTQEMHEKNEFGEASHMVYKFKDLLDVNLRNNPSVIKELNYWLAAKPQIDIFQKNVYVITPQGHIRKLPAGATALDFAYEIHRDIGNNCTSASINGNIAKLNTPLKNGDIVEISTSKANKKPARDWLDFVETPRAKREIRKALGAKLL